MTDADKKLKRYLAAIKRRLSLPRALKERVMSDLISSIRSRQETGKTTNEIIEELGSPSHAAAELNAQMKEFAYRRSPWRFLFAAAAIYGMWQLLARLIPLILHLLLQIRTPLTPAHAASVGIIGGADGPTAIFVTAPVWMTYILPVVLIIAGAFGYFRLKRCRPKA